MTELPEQYIARTVAEWVADGFIPEADAPRVIRLLQRGYLFGQLAGTKRITVDEWCEAYAESLRKLEAMSPQEYAAVKRRFNRAIKKAIE